MKSQPTTQYVVVAYDQGRAVCEMATIGLGLLARDAVYVARDLRKEFPAAIVAILTKTAFERSPALRIQPQV